LAIVPRRIAPVKPLRSIYRANHATHNFLAQQYGYASQNTYIDRHLTKTNLELIKKIVEKSSCKGVRKNEH
jgi:ribosomal protein S19E (S16A)